MDAFYNSMSNEIAAKFDNIRKEEGKFLDIYTCVECEKKFHDKFALLTHMKSCEKNTSTSLTSCLKCNKILSKNSFKAHMRLHTGEKPFSCSICEERFSFRSKLKYHKLQHGENEVRCGNCHRLYKNEQKLLSHKRCLSSDISQSSLSKVCVSRDTKTKKGDVDELFCDKEGTKCQGKVEKLININKSEKTNKSSTKHNEGFRRKCKNKQLATCSICHTILAKCSMKVHMRRHTGEKPLLCPLCGDRFKNHTALKQHRLRHGVSEIRCSICNILYINERRLRIHIKSKHNRIKDIETVISSAVNQKTSLKRGENGHTKTKEIGINTCNQLIHECVKCTLLLPSSLELYHHHRAHQDDHIFDCVLCLVNFNSSNTLKEHIQMRHVFNVTNGYKDTAKNNDYLLGKEFINSDLLNYPLDQVRDVEQNCNDIFVKTDSLPKTDKGGELIISHKSLAKTNTKNSSLTEPNDQDDPDNSSMEDDYYDISNESNDTLGQMCIEKREISDHSTKNTCLKKGISMDPNFEKNDTTLKKKFEKVTFVCDQITLDAKIQKLVRENKNTLNNSDNLKSCVDSSCGQTPSIEISENSQGQKCVNANKICSVIGVKEKSFPLYEIVKLKAHSVRDNVNNIMVNLSKSENVQLAQLALYNVTKNLVRVSINKYQNSNATSSDGCLEKILNNATNKNSENFQCVIGNELNGNIHELVKSAINKEVNCTDKFTTQNEEFSEELIKQQTDTSADANTHLNINGGNILSSTKQPGRNYKVYKCPYVNCNKECGNLHDLKNHTQTFMHTGKKLHKCTKCESSFAKSQTLKKHIIRKHTGGNYRCIYENCNKAYHTAFDLDKHKLNHTTSRESLSKGTNEGKHRMEPHVPYGEDFKRLNSAASHVKKPQNIKENDNAEIIVDENIERIIERPTLTADLSVDANTQSGVNNHLKTDETFITLSQTPKRDDNFCCLHENCSMAYATSFDLKQHMMIHGSKCLYICRKCKIPFHSSDSLKQHNRRTHKIKAPFNRYKCTFENCRRIFHLTSSLSIHLAKKHAVKDDHYTSAVKLCNICGFTCVSQHGLKQHLLTHSRTGVSVKKYKCTYANCNKAYTTISSLDTHTNTHTREHFYKCDMCSRSYLYCSSLKKHQDSVHLKKRFKCIHCDKLYSQERPLKEHIHKVHGEGQFEATEKVSCKICGALRTKGSMKDHLRLHENQHNWICDFCGAGFVTKCRLKQHRLTHMRRGQYLKCQICGIKLVDKYTLKYHLQTHTGERMYKCDKCDRAFRQKVTLENHRRTHTGEKPYVCDVCQCRFTHTSTLHTHKRTHTGERPYKCGECGLDFIDRSGRRSHIRIHHPQLATATTRTDNHPQLATATTSTDNQPHVATATTTAGNQSEVTVTNVSSRQHKTAVKKTLAAVFDRN